MNLIKPYKDQAGTRKEQVTRMFDSISERYDFLNHILSFNSDVRWRRKVVRKIKSLSVISQIPLNKTYILDVATGTGDMAIALARISPASITGIDISEGMLEIAGKKVKKKGISCINLSKGDSESIDFPDNSFDYVTVAFGVRNFDKLELGLTEMHRVLKKDGYLLILEFSMPSGILGIIYRFYSKHILPRFAAIFAKDKKAYIYLPESISLFPHGEKMRLKLTEAGFSSSVSRKLSGGIASLYVSKK